MQEMPSSRAVWQCPSTALKDQKVISCGLKTITIIYPLPFEFDHPFFEGKKIRTNKDSLTYDF
jgi:hypothetical protein